MGINSSIISSFSFPEIPAHLSLGLYSSNLAHFTFFLESNLGISSDDISIDVQLNCFLHVPHPRGSYHERGHIPALRRRRRPLRHLPLCYAP